MEVVCILAVTLLLLPCLQAREQPCSLSFHLLLQPPPFSINDNASAHPLQSLTGPHFFSNEPLVRNSYLGQSPTLQVGSAAGLYLASAADSMEMRYIFFTATLQRYFEPEGDGEAWSGTVVLVGNVSSGMLSIVGGTGDFMSATGEAKVAMKGAASLTTMAVLFELELIYRQQRKENGGASVF